jgi:Trypsin-like peptidase domain/Tetratricopeptide repeat
MPRTVDLKVLREYALRVVDVTTRELLGTGSFITPDCVLTCAHVVEDRETVRLSASDGSAANGTVIARTARPTAEHGLWPFPDLAIVRLPPDRTELRGQACVLLEDREPLSSETCYTYGFPRRGDFGATVGSSAAVKFESVEEDGYLKFQAGQIKPGVSGAPMVSPARGAVIGITTATRGSAGDLGGFASPVNALRFDVPGVTSEGWRELGKQLFRDNTDAIIADRGRWHRVLPITDAQRASLDQQWRTTSYTRTELSHPSELLRADYRITPYLFRERALADAVQWCHRPAAVSILTATADGGEGKTRFAIELASTMARAGWLTGFQPADPDRAQTAIATATPRLIVVDYAETLSPQSLEGLLTAAVNHASRFAPVRLLMLTRSHDARADRRFHALGIGLKAREGEVFNNRGRSAEATKPLTMEQRAALFSRAATDFALAWRVPQTDVRPPLAEARHASPLQVLYAALDAVLSSAADDFDDADEADKVLNHEGRYWRRAPTYPPNLAIEVTRQAVALATLVGADDPRSADKLLATVPRLAADPLLRAQTATWLHDFYPGTDWLNPVLPDRLGERLVESVLLSRTAADGPDLTPVLLAADGNQTLRALTVLNRIAATVPSRLDAIARRLAPVLDQLIDRSKAQSHGTADAPGSAMLAEILSQLLVRTSAQLAAGLDASDLEDLSASYDRLGNVIRSSNQAEALRVFQAALAIDELLVRQAPENASYQYELSISYERIAGLMAASDPAEAERLYLAAVDEFERLAAADRDDIDYQRGLSRCYRRLGILAAAYDRAKAEGFHRAALAKAEELSANDRDNNDYWDDIALSNTNLGDLAASTDRTEAHRLHSAALDIRKRLLENEPANRYYQRELSISYERLGNLAMDSNPAEAQRFHREALRIRKELADGQPDNTDYQRLLAYAYDRLAALATDPVEAHRFHRAALAIRVLLPALDIDNTTDQRNLSITLGRLAALMSADDPAEAASLVRAAVVIDERIAGSRPDNTRYQLDLSASYDELGQLVAKHDPAEAERLYRAALAIDERLAAAHPDDVEYQRNLSAGLSRIGNLIEERDPAEAERLYRAAKAVDDALAAAHPDDAEYQHSRSVSYNDLADVVLARDPAEAEDLYRTALEIDERLAADHPNNPEYQDSYAVALNKVGDLIATRDPDAARHWYHRALAISERLAATHPENPAYRRRVTSCLDRLRRLDALDQRSVLALTLEHRQQALGEDHPESLWAAHRFASVLRELGEFANARDMDREVLTRRRRVLGADHPHTLWSAEFLAVDLRNLGDDASAQDVDREVLTQRRAALGPDHPHTLWSADALATDLRRTGDHDQARELLHDILQRRRRTLGEDHLDTRYSKRRLDAATSRVDSGTALLVPGLAVGEPTTDWDRYATAASVISQRLIENRVSTDGQHLSTDYEELWYDGRYVEAIDLLSSLIEADPANPDLRSARGQILADLGVAGPASRDLRQAIAEFGAESMTAAYAYSAWGYAFAVLSRREQSDDAFRISLKAAPENAWTFFRRGLIEYARGEVNAALGDLEASLRAEHPSLNGLQRGKAEHMIAHLSPHTGTTPVAAEIR